MISVQGFSKHYGDFLAVNNASFDVPPGAIAALVGPNGAGKTTTIRTLCGLLRPTCGNLVVADANLATDGLEAKRRIAYVPDDPPLFEPLTVYEHLRFIASSYQLPEWTDYADELLSMFALSDKRDTLASELSRGMRQKVAISCAYLRHPKVLLLDEPMTGLDPASIRVLKDSIGSQAQRGATVLVSSHLLSLVDDMCDYLVTIQKGEILFSGSVQEAKNKFGGADTTLEEVFFRLTGKADEPALRSSEQAGRVSPDHDE